MEKILEYPAGETQCRGFFISSEPTGQRRPIIMLFPTWKGIDAFAKDRANALVALGYDAFCVDLYGDGKVAGDEEEALALMLPLFCDRGALQQRGLAAMSALSKEVVGSCVPLGAIGFCFGGLAALEFLRAGAEVRGVVCFHAVLGESISGKVATPAPHAESISASLLVLHGQDDPLVSREDIAKVQDELTAAGVDWQFHIYSHTAHAFTNPAAKSPENGMYYQKRSAARAWLAMENFFNEIM